jgi:predicted MFS family arabinose efflux permease
MATPQIAVSEARAAVPSRARARYALGALMLVMMLSHVDRNVLNMLIGPIKRELAISDSAMGTLIGFGFALSHTLAGVPFARLADRRSRTAIVLGGLALWSLVTAAQGLARAFWHLLVGRVLVGLGEATTSPASHSLISDYFPPQRRATALAVFTMGGHIGMMLGYMAGGSLAEWLGWRAAFVAVGLPGLVLAGLMAATLREPARGAIEARSDLQEHSFREVSLYLWRRPAFRHVFMTASLSVMAVYGFNVWSPEFLMRVHGMSASEAGWLFGPATGLAGMAGTLVSGALCDRLAKGEPRWAMRISALGAAGMVPFSLGFLLSPDPRLAIGFYAVQVFLATFWMAPCYWLCQGLARLRMRAMAPAILLLGINLIGGGLGPQVVGWLNDALREAHGELGIRYSMLALSAASLWSALHAARANRSVVADLAAARR